MWTSPYDTRWIIVQWSLIIHLSMMHTTIPYHSKSAVFYYLANFEGGQDLRTPFNQMQESAGLLRFIFLISCVWWCISRVMCWLWWALCCFEWDGWRAGDGSGSPPIQKRERFEFESHQFGPDGIIWTHLNIQRSTHMQCNTIPYVESTSRFDGKWEVIQNKIGGLFKFYAKEFFTFMRKRETQICV